MLSRIQYLSQNQKIGFGGFNMDRATSHVKASIKKAKAYYELKIPFQKICDIYDVNISGPITNVKAVISPLKKHAEGQAAGPDIFGEAGELVITHKSLKDSKQGKILISKIIADVIELSLKKIENLQNINKGNKNDTNIKK